MKQPVKVHHLEEDGAVYVIYPNPGSEKSRTSRSFWGVKEKPFPASNAHVLNVQEGDMVEILVNPAGAMKAAFMMFIFPLLCFLLVYTVAAKVIQEEVLLYLMGTIGLAGGFLVNALIRKFRGPGEMPSIERILSKAEIRKWKSCNSACQSCKGCG